MAEPDNLVLVMLREIRAVQDEQPGEIAAMRAEHRADFASLNKKVDEGQETTATAVGLATHANLRNAAIEAKLADLAERVVALERARGA